MKNYYCGSAGLARSCGDCRHNPMNQAGQRKGAPIKPTIRADLKCPYWSAVRNHAVTPSQSK